MHSGETLDNLASCLRACGSTDLFRSVLVCPSARVGERARALGFHHIAVARNAGDTAMLAALEKALSA